VCSNKRGFTLIELMIAILILTISMVGLLDTLGKYLQINMDNTMRNEAMRIVEAQMEQLRNMPFISLPANGTTTTTYQNGTFRKIVIPFKVDTIVNDLSLRTDVIPSVPNSKAIQVQVTWTSKGTPHQHNAATVITNDW
jgi:type IV pilus assembly protein PilV